MKIVNPSYVKPRRLHLLRITYKMRRSILSAATRGAAHTRPSQQHRTLLVARAFTTTISRTATALPITATGPPPSPPQPNASQYERIERKRKQIELLEKGKELRQQEQSPGSTSKQSPLRKRFWKDVHVREVPEGYQVFLDARPVKTPLKSNITVPKSKAHLAHAIAIEWDLLVSAQEALKNHNIPMTSIVARAQDLIEAETKGDKTERAKILKVMMRYLDTDTLLCWAPEKNIHEGMSMDGASGSDRAMSLRQQQIELAKPIIGHLNTSVWPGVELKPTLGENSILPVQQSEVTRSIISGWLSGLPAYELAAIERATLATKSLLIGTRLTIEWSEEFRHVQKTREGARRFGIEEAEEASTAEVRWQTGMWGEVEDTHDVEREDLRRQLGAAVLVVSGVS